jgi:hypothetical protein
MDKSEKIREILQDYSVKQIEEQIFQFNSPFVNDDISTLLEIRKNIINHYVLQQLELVLPDIVAFNDALREALRTTYEKGRMVYDTNKALDSNVRLEATCFLSKDYPKLHPLQGDYCDNLWRTLCEKQYNDMYRWGAGYYCMVNQSFDEFIGATYNENWNDGLNPELTKDLHLIKQFHDLFEDTEFAITDFIYCRDFYHEISVKINY